MGVSLGDDPSARASELASYNQQSQRYVAFAEEPTFVVPPDVAPMELPSKRFETATRAAFDYRGRSRPASAPGRALRVLPNAVETKIVVTMNMRELLHFFELRCCNRAQWEIRELALGCSISSDLPRHTSSWTRDRPAGAGHAERAR
jgi:flavin-dependent thymidylate synthase